MDEMLERFVNNLVGRLSGPLTFRFLIQLPWRRSSRSGTG